MTAQLRSSPHQAELHTSATWSVQPEGENPIALRPLELVQDIGNAVRMLKDSLPVIESNLQIELVLTGSGVLRARFGCNGRVRNGV